MDLKAGQSRIKTEIDKRRDLEERLAKLTLENEDIRRRLETATCGSTVETVESGNINSSIIQDSGVILDDNIDIDSIQYHERFAYSLEHYGKITSLILLDSKYLGFTSTTPTFYFASADILACVKIWDLDSKESLMTLYFQEQRFSNSAEPPPPIRDML